MNSVLMVVDVQNALIEGHPFNELKVIENIKNLISAARDNGKELVFVRHVDEGSGFAQGAAGWEIYEEVKPIGQEKIFNKYYNSAFIKTGLEEYLQTKNIDTIILTGLQTDYCIDATCKSALEHGYKVIIPEESNTTFDNEFLSGEKVYQYFNFKIWDNRFGKVLPVEEVINILKDKQ